jgi:hypothetical protein
VKPSIRTSPGQSLRDAAALLFVILLALTVRLGPADAVVELVPASQAGESAAPADPADVDTEVALDVPARPVPAHPVAAGVEVFPLDGGKHVLRIGSASDDTVELDTEKETTVCRITRRPTGPAHTTTIEASCELISDARERLSELRTRLASACDQG